MATPLPAPARKLVVEVVEARNLLPKDGTGTSSPYARVDFDGQRRKTRTVARDLNPVWNEALEFSFAGDDAAAEPLEVCVFHDLHVGPTRRSNFLGRARLGARHFVRRGEEALMFFPLEKKGFFSSWVRGDIGLRIYYVDPEPPPPEPEPEPEAPAAAPSTGPTEQADGAAADAAAPEAEVPQEPTPANAEQPLESGDAPHEEAAAAAEQAVEATPAAPVIVVPVPVAVAMTSPRKLPEVAPEPVERTKFDLVDKMQYLFVRMVRARGLPGGARPHVRVAAAGRHASTLEARRGAFYEWGQTFAFPRERDVSGDTIEVSVWDLPPDADTSLAGDEHFLGGLCFDAGDLPSRDPPDSTLATQWYRLEGRGMAGDLMLAAWSGTQADEAFAGAWKADAPQQHAAASRAKVYVSPKLWYLRVTVIEMQDTLSSPLPREAGVAVKAALGFQALKTRTIPANRNGGYSWSEDLIFVAAEPFGSDERERVTLTLEVRLGRDIFPVGAAAVALGSIERRVDDRRVASKWLDIVPATEGTTKKGRSMSMHGGRLHVRACFDGGYHVADEMPHASSDFRPSARQLWRPPLGAVELGIVGCRGLLPVRTVDGGKGSTDAFALAKYGPKWARSRTVADCFDPQWNEQYTWPVYDPCTLLTVAVFDDPSCRPLGKVRIRIAALESGRAYRSAYPLVMVLPTGAKRMGEIELAVRFTTSCSPLEILHLYGQPTLPPMHHLRPIPAAQRDALRLAAARISTAHLGRYSDPPLRREAAMWVLDAAEPHHFSVRKLRANWNRIVAAMEWTWKVANWAEELRTWRSPPATIMAHLVVVLLAWHPDMVVPMAALNAAAVGVVKYRRRPRGPAAHPMAEMGDREELEEELDTVPSSRAAEAVRARYEKLRTVGARVQEVLGEVAAQAERVQAVVRWEDARASRMFVAACVAVAVVLFFVPMRVMAVVAGFYYLRHRVFRDRTKPPAMLNFFRRLPSMADRVI